MGPVPEHPALIRDPEIRAAYAADTSGLRSVPEAVARPASEEEVAELLRFCHAHRVGVTPQGLRSSTTGSAVPLHGIALSLERMNRLIEIDPERGIAIVEPGMVTADFKRAARARGLFYPPDPTSEEESTLGGNVACNASGSRTYRYGATREYVRALRVALADGSVIEVRRIAAAKNAAGYFGFQNPVDLWVGSEGTLGVITRIEVDLLPVPAGFFGAMAFFPDWRAAIEFVLAADRAARGASRRAGGAVGTRRADGAIGAGGSPRRIDLAAVQPRCLELFDRASLELVGDSARGLHIPAGAGAAIFFEEELGDPPAFAHDREGARAEAGDGGRDRSRALEASLERWLPLIEAHGGLSQETIVATTEAEQAALRKLRHAIPTTMNERGEEAVRRGGRRVGTDFAVPLPRLPEMLAEVYAIVRERFGGFAIVYGHVGSGHPHVNFLAQDPEALVRAGEAARALTRRALEMGGTLSGEHGIGKVKAALFREFYPAWMIEGMRAVKERLDPRGILSPGNLA